MAAYATVTWGPADEVTSDKLAQMAMNESWLKDNLIVGNISAPPNALGQVAEGRDSVVQGVSKLEAISYAFDSQVPVAYHLFDVPLPPVFTEPPVVAISYDVVGQWSIMHVYAVDTTKVRIKVANGDGLIRLLQGVVRVIATGR